MMMFPLNFWDISLFLALISVISLITSEILSTSYAKLKIKLDIKKFKTISYATTILFVATVFLRVISIILAS